MAFPLTYAQYIVRKPAAASYPEDLVQDYLDAAAEAIVDYAGPTIDEYVVNDRTETFRPNGDQLMLSERASSIVEVEERAHYASPTTLAADDYELSASGYMLRRLRGGTISAPAWRPLVKVTYLPYSDDARRVAAQMALVELEFNHTPGARQETIGSWSEQQGQGAADYQTERAAILATLRSDPVVMF